MTPGSGPETDALSDASITAQAARAKELRLALAVIGFPTIVYEMTLASRPASPGTNVPSRNRSAPLELCFPSYGSNHVEAHLIPPERPQIADRSLAVASLVRSGTLTPVR